MKSEEYKAARLELLAGEGIPKKSSARVFGMLLGYSQNKPNQLVREKERGYRPIVLTDEIIIGLLRIIKARDGNIRAALERWLKVEKE